MPHNASPLSKIQQADLVREWFGYWPTFHDADLVEFNYRATDDVVSFTLHAFEMTDRVNSDGYIELAKHCLVTLQAHGSVQVSFQDFALGNILLDLEFVAKGHRLVLRLDSAIDGECVITADGCRVEALNACDAEGVTA